MHNIPHMLNINPRAGTNRANIRLVEQEMKAITPQLRHVEECFLKDLFDPECKASYKETYDNYLLVWKTTVQAIKNGRMFMMWQINEDYFSVMYSPIVTPPSMTYNLFTLINIGLKQINIIK